MYALFAIIAAILILKRVTFRMVPASAVIVDGDTIRVDGTPWRITGYDAPEWDQPGGAAASGHLRALVREGRMFAIVRGWDVYGRPLATIITRRGPLSWRMVASGHAHGEGLVPSTLTLFARIARRGMWGIKGRVISPRMWRAGYR